MAMSGILQRWMFNLGSICRNLICCTSTKFADLTSLSELDSGKQPPVARRPEFVKAYHDYRPHKAQVHYADFEDPKIETIFRISMPITQAPTGQKITQCSLRARVSHAVPQYYDDLSTPYRLQRPAETLQSNEHVEAVAGRYQFGKVQIVEVLTSIEGICRGWKIVEYDPFVT